MISLFQLVDVQLDFHYLDRNDVDVLYDIFTVFEQSSKLSVLIIRSLIHRKNIYPYLKRIIRRIPSQRKY